MSAKTDKKAGNAPVSGGDRPAEATKRERDVRSQGQVMERRQGGSEANSPS